MPKPEDDPEYWLKRVREARSALDTLTNAEAREHMRNVIECYERLARLAEQARDRSL